MMAAARRLPVVVVLGATGTGKSKLAIELGQRFNGEIIRMGKSKLAIELGQRFNGEIISADSMQMYRALDVITNKVTAEEQAQCPHHLLSVLDPLTANNTVVDFRNMALPIMEKLLGENKIPVIVGGTNYYIESLLWNFLIDKQTAELARDAGKGRGGLSLPEAGSQGAGDSETDPRHLSTNTPENPDSLLSNQVPSPSSRSCHDSDGTTSQTPGVAARSDLALTSEDSDWLSSEDDVGSDSKETASKEEHSSRARQEKEGGYAGFDSAHLHDLLHRVDPETAKRLHPKNRRKVVRALQVHDHYGVPLSQIHRTQHTQGSTLGLSGSLRFPHCCVFWLQSQQDVLDQRLDGRVEDMLRKGLVSELHGLHAQYLASVAAQNGEADYTLGIFQSIGFKEFHQYLILPLEQRETPEGKALFEKGVEGLKLATRQYARRQLKWIKNRFLKRAGTQVPAVYSLDSTDPSQWASLVLQPATDILTAVIDGGKVPVDPMSPDDLPGTVHVHNVCEVCDGRVFTTLQEWQAHLGSRRHKKMQQHKRNKEKTNNVHKQRSAEPTESSSNR
ncbi:hypothetical protein ACOMHN_014002 [Nucella lapillus]